ncbi:MAG: hypothetical protein AAFN44_19270 [Pseudomonadota bacterium]
MKKPTQNHVAPSQICAGTTKGCILKEDSDYGNPLSQAVPGHASCASQKSNTQDHATKSMETRISEMHRGGNPEVWPNATEIGAAK